MIVEKMIKKYAKLLLEALRVRDKKYLFIQLPSFLESLKTILLDEAKSYDLDDVYVYEVDVFKKHELLSYLDQENINKHPTNILKYLFIVFVFLFTINKIIPIPHSVQHRISSRSYGSTVLNSVSGRTGLLLSHYLLQKIHTSVRHERYVYHVMVQPIQG